MPSGELPYVSRQRTLSGVIPAPLGLVHYVWLCLLSAYLNTGGIYQCILRILSGVHSTVEFPSEQGSESQPSELVFKFKGDSKVITDDL